MSDMPGGILLATINAKWIHPSLALRLLKANLGPLEDSCAIVEFALRQPLREKVELILAARPRILGLSVSIWNHTATLELLRELHKEWEGQSGCPRPIIVLGGPEVSYLSPNAEIFTYADYCIRGEGESAFRELCEKILEKGDCHPGENRQILPESLRTRAAVRKKGDSHLFMREITFINSQFQPVDVSAIKSAYHLYTDEDVRKKLLYVEASRGCPFGCEFCLSARTPQVREFPLEPFLAEMDDLLRRGARTLKFLDRSFNLNIERARRIMDFFLDRMAAHPLLRERTEPFVVHFEMVPSRFPPELVETLARFPAGTLRLEIGIQTLNPEVSARIGRSSDPARELAALRLLKEKTAAIIHADLIAGLPGEDMASFARGFDLLWTALSQPISGSGAETHSHTEIQLGILKLLPGAPIARHTAAFGMRYNPAPPYEILESSALPARDLDRLKNFARFWELIVNRKLIHLDSSPIFDCMRGYAVPETNTLPKQQTPALRDGVFARFMSLSDSLFARFGRSWGIDKNDLQNSLKPLF